MSKESDHIASQFDKRREAQRKQEEAKRRQQEWQKSDCVIAWLALAWEVIRRGI